MTKIVGGGGKAPSKTVGRPGFKQLVAFPAPRRRVGLVTHAAQKGVTRLLRRDPSKFQGDAPFGGLHAQDSKVTAISGANNDLKFTAQQFGPHYTTPIRVRYVVSGSNTALSVSVSGSDITVNVATGVAEVQKIVVDATGGKWDFVYSGQTAADLDWNISAEDLQTAIIALSNVGPTDVVVTGGPGNSGGTHPYILTWAASAGNVAQPTCVSTSLTGGAHTATPSTVTGGDATAPITTAAGVKAAIEASSTARALVQVELAKGNDGTGIVAAMGYITLVGGGKPDIQGGNGGNNPNVVKPPANMKSDLAAARGGIKVVDRSKNRSVKRRGPVT